MSEVLASLPPLDAALSAIGLGALVLVIYLAWARRRLARLDRADEVVERVLSQDEVDRILRLAGELTERDARPNAPTSS